MRGVISFTTQPLHARIFSIFFFLSFLHLGFSYCFFCLAFSFFACFFFWWHCIYTWDVFLSVFHWFHDFSLLWWPYQYWLRSILLVAYCSPARFWILDSEKLMKSDDLISQLQGNQWISYRKNPYDSVINLRHFEQYFLWAKVSIKFTIRVRNVVRRLNCPWIELCVLSIVSYESTALKCKRLGYYISTHINMRMKNPSWSTCLDSERREWRLWNMSQLSGY